MKNDTNRAEKNRTEIGGIIFSALLFGLIGVGCTPSTDGICREFPAVSEEISTLQTQLAAMDTRPDSKRSKKASRRIASVNPPLSLEDIADRQEAWMDWGEKTLKQTQWSKDALEGNRQLRKAVLALNDAGMALVSFHGYLEQKKWRKAENELKRVDTSLRKARTVACEAEPVNPVKKRKN